MSRRWSRQVPPVRALALWMTLAVPGTAEEPSWPAIFRDTTEVRVTNLEVRVSDAKGRPITGLQANEFELLIDGEPVPIDHFSAFKDGRAAGPLPDLAAPPADPGAASPASPAGPLHLIVYVDNANLDAIERKRALSRLRDYLNAKPREDLRTMLVSNDRSLVVRQDFTSDLGAIFSALDGFDRTVPTGQLFALERRRIIRAIEELNVESGGGFLPGAGAVTQAQQEIVIENVAAQARALIPQLRIYSQQRSAHLLQSLEVLSQLLDTAAGLPHRKALVYLSGGLPLQPGEALYEAFERYTRSLPLDGDRISPQSEAARFSALSALTRLAERANAAGVSFYCLDTGLDSALRSGAAETRSPFWIPAMATIEQQNRQASLSLMADATGGRVALNGGLDRLLDGLLSDFDHYYSLGFSSDAGSGEQRKIEVRVKRPGLRLRYPASLQSKSTDQEMQELTLAALLSDEIENPLAIRVHRGPTQEAEGEDLFGVPILVDIPLGQLVLLPGQVTHEAQLTMYVAARDEQGRTSPVVKNQCPIRIPNSELLLAMGRTARCGMRLVMRGGPQRLVVAIRDELAAKSSTAALQLEVPGEEPPQEAPPPDPADSGR